MTKPKPAPVKPKPITHDPHAGQLQVVVSFRTRRKGDLSPWDAGRIVRYAMARAWGEMAEELGLDMADLDVAVRVIGAQGETSEDEGRWDLASTLALTEDVERRVPGRDRTDVDTGGKL